jgi:hypothetical protein
MTTSASANTALTSASYHVDAGQKIVSGEDLAQVVPQQHASRRRRGSLRCQRSPLRHHAFVGIRQGALLRCRVGVSTPVLCGSGAGLSEYERELVEGDAGTIKDW